MNTSFLFSRPALAIAISLIIGMVLANSMSLTLAVVGAFILAACVLLTVIFFRKKILFSFLLILVALFGYVHMASYLEPTISSDSIYYQTNTSSVVHLMGEVQNIEKRSDHSYRIVLAAQKIILPNLSEQKSEDLLLLHVEGHLNPPLELGSVLLVPVKIKPFQEFKTPGGFDYKRYRMQQGIYARAFVRSSDIVVISTSPPSFFSKKILSFRESIAIHIDQAVSDTDANAVLKALLIGNRLGISPDLKEAFSHTGTAHLLAISGLHVGLVATLFFFLFRGVFYFFNRLNQTGNARRIAAIATIFPVLIYGILSGMSPSTQRAVVMTILFLLSFLFRRKTDALTTLSLAAIVIIIVFPPALFSVSFQLSFIAVLFILVGKPLIQVGNQFSGIFSHFIFRKRWALFWVSTLASIATSALTMFYFHQISWIAPIFNLLMVPLIGLGVVSLGIFSTVSLLFSSAVAHIGFWVAGKILEEGIALILYVNTFSSIAIQTHIPSWKNVLFYYAIFILFYFSIKAYIKYHPVVSIKSAVTVLVGFLLATLLAFTGLFFYTQKPASAVEFTMLDVQQGSCFLLKLPTDEYVMIDCGNVAFREQFDIGKHVVLPFLRHEHISRIDTIILSHPDTDHMNGFFSIIENIPVKEFWKTNWIPLTDEEFLLWSLCDEKKIKKKTMMAPHRYQKAGVTIDILWPPDVENRTKKPRREKMDTNENSMVLKIQYKNVSFLVPGDIGHSTEKQLISIYQDGLKSTVLVAPHHGSRFSLSSDFIEKVSPDIVLISGRAYGQFLFPHPDTLHRLDMYPVTVLQTRREGTVRLKTNGDSIEYEILQ